MAICDLVRPLEADWQATLDGVARGRGWPTSGEPARLAVQLAKLSAAYNGEGSPGGTSAAAIGTGAARLAFSFARDVPKAAGAVRELVASGALAMPEGRPLRVLDLGAGLGATTWGLARALEAHGAKGELEATWVDGDAEALEVAQAIARARAAAGVDAVRVVGRPVRADLNAGSDAALGKLERTGFDVVVLGQVLSELDRGEAGTPARIARHAGLVRKLLRELVAPTGSLVVVEPALRDRTRHLHAIRDALLADAQASGASSPDARVTLFAPCLHAASCPALAHPGDWCHEDLAVDLPAWLVPVARGAGLRWQGLTFSYLVLRKDGRTLAAALPRRSGAPALRVVSGPLVSKGKREAFMCGELPSPGDPPGARSGGRVRAMRLDRDESATNAAWDELPKGTLVAIEPELDPARPRVGREAVVSELFPSFEQTQAPSD